MAKTLDLDREVVGSTFGRVKEQLVTVWMGNCLRQVNHLGT